MIKLRIGHTNVTLAKEENKIGIICLHIIRLTKDYWLVKALLLLFELSI